MRNFIQTKFWLIMVTLSLLTGPTLSQINSHLKEEFHDAELYGIRIIDNVAGLRAAMHDDTVRVLAFQAFAEELDAESHTELIEWVREGNSVWFYDARLAPMFGMKPVFIDSSGFRTKGESGVLGGKKRSGVATTAMSIGAHAVQTSVGQVTIFLPEVQDADSSEKLYGGVEVGGDTHALLQATLEAPAFMACRREGKGFIVFKTLLWNEPLSGDRFQLNLLEYSAGFQVPGPAGAGKVGNPPGPDAEYIEGKPLESMGSVGSVRPVSPSAVTPSSDGSTPLENTSSVPTSSDDGAWSLEMADGTTIVGEFEAKVVEFETGSRSLKLSLDELESLEFGSAIKLDRIETTNGKTESGLLLSAPIRFRTSRGVEEFEKDDLVKLFRSKK